MPELRRVTADGVVDTPEPRLTKDGDSWSAAFFFMVLTFAWGIREDPEKLTSKY